MRKKIIIPKSWIFDEFFDERKIKLKSDLSMETKKNVKRKTK